MLSHLIIETHYGSNVELLINQLKQTEIFHIIITEDREYFIKQYEKDIADNIVYIPLDESEYSEENWKNFYINSYERLKYSYGPNFNKFMIQIYYGISNEIKKDEFTKIISFARHPQFSWIINDNEWITPKYFMVLYKNIFRKTLSGYLDLFNFVSSHGLDSEEALFEYVSTLKYYPLVYELINGSYQTNQILLGLLFAYLGIDYIETDKEEHWNIFLSYNEYKNRSSYNFRRYFYNWDFTEDEDVNDLLIKRFNPEIELLKSSLDNPDTEMLLILFRLFTLDELYMIINHEFDFNF